MPEKKGEPPAIERGLLLVLGHSGPRHSQRAMQPVADTHVELALLLTRVLPALVREPVPILV